MSSNLRNQAPLFTELRLLQGTYYCFIFDSVNKQKHYKNHRTKQTNQ